jgi:hypothetical protein
VGALVLSLHLVRASVATWGCWAAESTASVFCCYTITVHYLGAIEYVTERLGLVGFQELRAQFYSLPLGPYFGVCISCLCTFPSLLWQNLAASLLNLQDWEGATKAAAKALALEPVGGWNA